MNLIISWHGVVPDRLENMLVFCSLSDSWFCRCRWLDCDCVSWGEEVSTLPQADWLMCHQWRRSQLAMCFLPYVVSGCGPHTLYCDCVYLLLARWIDHKPAGGRLSTDRVW